MTTANQTNGEAERYMSVEESRRLTMENVDKIYNIWNLEQKIKLR